MEKIKYVFRTIGAAIKRTPLTIVLVMTFVAMVLIILDGAEPMETILITRVDLFVAFIAGITTAIFVNYLNKIGGTIDSLKIVNFILVIFILALSIMAKMRLISAVVSITMCLIILKETVELMWNLRKNKR